MSKIKKIFVSPKIEPNACPQEEKSEKKQLKPSAYPLILAKVLEISRGSTSHGIPNIFKPTRAPIRVLWTVCFLAALTTCSFMIFLSITDYYSYDVVTKYETVSEIPSPFPAVSICNVNPLTTQEAVNLTEFFLESEFNLPNLSDYALTPNDNIFLYWANKLSMVNAIIPDYGEENRLKLGSSGSIISSSFNGLYEYDFVSYFDINYGNCFRFNSGKNSTGHKVPIKFSYKPGIQSGLNVIMYLPASVNRYSWAFNEGLRIFLHNSSLEPSEADAVDISPGKQTNIAIKRTFAYKQPDPYSSCINLANFDSALYRSFKESSKIYRQRDCIDLCIQQRIIKNCSCYDLNYRRLFNSSPCRTRATISCAETQYFEFVSNEISHECLDQCPLECDSVSYELTLSSSDFPSRFVYERYKSFFPMSEYELFKKMSVSVNIYYPSLEYSKLTELPKTSVIDLFSSIGGTLGLYIGISFLSLIELVEIVMEVFFILFNL
jgi:hypothetical protein